MIDILAIRDALNPLPFRDGRRQVFIGRISDNVPLPEPEDDEEESNQPRVVEDTPAVLEYLRQMEAALAQYDLKLLRDHETRDALYAVQDLKTQSSVDLSWMGDAYAWTARIIAVGLLMVAPGVAGMWLDDHYDRNFMAAGGFMLGLVLAVLYLFYLTKAKRRAT